jgi:4'-phosphopantetheinyl transferase EntD
MTVVGLRSSLSSSQKQEDQVDSELSRLFPSEVRVVEASGALCDAPLLPAEEDCVRDAVAKRRREFAMGRACARVALADFGIEGFPLLSGPNRAPIWPDGIIGSITHCDGLTAAAVARRGTLMGIGIDAEPAAPLDRDLAHLVCTEDERKWMETVRPPPNSDWGKVLFSAKEAVHKCTNPLNGVMLDFLQLSIEIVPELNSFCAHLQTDSHRGLIGFRRLQGRFMTSPSHVSTGAVVKS